MTSQRVSSSAAGLSRKLFWPFKYHPGNPCSKNLYLSILLMGNVTIIPDLGRLYCHSTSSCTEHRVWWCHETSRKHVEQRKVLTREKG
uniref:Uncharacterized protein n=1 Tax=Hyaloperonospora arabidopsidis (strain Emoy2) TaxID=559515 RepID=M4C1Y0_HYAAE